MTDLQSCVLRIVNGCCTTDSGFYTGEIADRMGRHLQDKERIAA